MGCEPLRIEHHRVVLLPASRNRKNDDKGQQGITRQDDDDGVAIAERVRNLHHRAVILAADRQVGAQSCRAFVDDEEERALRDAAVPASAD